MQRPRRRRSYRRPAEEVSAGGIVVRRCDEGPVFLVICDAYRNWGFPKGHVELGESPEEAAVREVREETGIDDLEVVGPLETIEWYFQFNDRTIHKVCHFYLLRTTCAQTVPQREEGITACRWETYQRAFDLIPYENARSVLKHALALLEPATPVQ